MLQRKYAGRKKTSFVVDTEACLCVYVPGVNASVQDYPRRRIQRTTVTSQHVSLSWNKRRAVDLLPFAASYPQGSTNSTISRTIHAVVATIRRGCPFVTLHNINSDGQADD